MKRKLVLNTFAIGVLLGCQQTPPPEPVIIDRSNEMLVEKLAELYEQEASKPGLKTTPATAKFKPLSHHKTIADYVESLSLTLVEGFRGEMSQSQVMITSFVSLDQSLQHSNQLGNQLAEQSFSQLHQFGMNVVERNLAEVVNADNSALFRQKNLVNSKASHVLTGTLIHRNDGVEVNARIVDVNTKLSVANAKQLIPYYIIKASNIAIN